METEQGLILIDTGFSHQDIVNSGWRERLAMRSLSAIADPDECAITQIRKLGFKPEDVTHIILTHLDVDHAGGIKDFPHAQVHLHRQEWQAAVQPMTWYEKVRYQRKDWQHQPNWQLHQPTGERWHGFDAVRLLDAAIDDILLIPLTGHSRGHSGVAIATEQGWLLHCGDAYFHQDEVKLARPHCPLGLNLIQRVDEACRADRLHNQLRLRQLYQNCGDQITLICSHDPNEFAACCAAGHGR